MYALIRRWKESRPYIVGLKKDRPNVIIRLSFHGLNLSINDLDGQHISIGRGLVTYPRNANTAPLAQNTADTPAKPPIPPKTNGIMNWDARFTVIRSPSTSPRRSDGLTSNTNDKLSGCPKPRLPPSIPTNTTNTVIQGDKGVNK